MTKSDPEINRITQLKFMKMIIYTALVTLKINKITFYKDIHKTVHSNKQYTTKTFFA